MTTEHNPSDSALELWGIQQLRPLFPGLTWRRWSSANGRGEIWAAYCFDNPHRSDPGHPAKGECAVLLYMCNGAQAQRHQHLTCEGWPYTEAITVFRGRVCGIDPHDPERFLIAGNSMDIVGDRIHAPRVLDGEEVLLFFHQPAGSVQV